MIADLFNLAIMAIAFCHAVGGSILQDRARDGHARRVEAKLE